MKPKRILIGSTKVYKTDKGDSILYEEVWPRGLYEKVHGACLPPWQKSIIANLHSKPGKLRLFR